MINAPRSLLYVPGSNSRALEKAPTLGADMIIIDLEDAVPDDSKGLARTQMTAAVAGPLGAGPFAIRVNAPGTAHHAGDMAAVQALSVRPTALVIPKVDAPDQLDAIGANGIPMIAMIESPAAVFAARTIAAHPQVVALLAGFNDLAHALRLPTGTGRAALTTAMQMLVLAARAEGRAVFDGVYNRIDDAPGFADEAHEARAFGFDGKSLIHPSQVAPCNAIFSPTEEEVAAAQALVDAATSGAQRHNGAMVEDMHVAAARDTLARAQKQ